MIFRVCFWFKVVVLGLLYCGCLLLRGYLMFGGNGIWLIVMVCGLNCCLFVMVEMLGCLFCCECDVLGYCKFISVAYIYLYSLFSFWVFRVALDWLKWYFVVCRSWIRLLGLFNCLFELFVLLWFGFIYCC